MDRLAALGGRRGAGHVAGRHGPAIGDGWGAPTPLRQLAWRLTPRSGQVAAEFVAALRSGQPDLSGAGNEQVWAHLERVVQACTLDFLERLVDDRCPPETPPEELADAARALSALGIPLENALRLVRDALPVAIQQWNRAFEAMALDGAATRALRDVCLRYTVRYLDRLADLLVEVHRREPGPRASSSETRRLELVRAVLQRRTADAPLLAYELGGHHVGAIAFGSEPRAALHSIAEHLDRRPLVLELTCQTAWGWFGGFRPFRAEELRVLARARPARGARLAIGDPAAGSEGFRRTHHEAGLAHRVALSGNRQVTLHRDVALEALSGHDEEGARQFVERELGAIGHGERARTLRETLRVYFEAGQNAKSTGMRLGVTGRCVGYRIRSVEDQIGCPVHDRRAELEVALRLEAMLHSL